MTALRERMIQDMRIRNLARNTEKTYLRQVSLFARHFKKSPELLGMEDIRSYQIYMVRDKKVSVKTAQNAVAALRFLYKITLRKDWDFSQVLPQRGKADVLFPSAKGEPLSVHGVQYLLNKHRLSASKTCPSLKQKRVTVHRLRHTTAMDLLQEGVDRSVIALWLGHESVETTQIYLAATLAMKERRSPKQCHVAASEAATAQEIQAKRHEILAAFRTLRIRRIKGSRTGFARAAADAVRRRDIRAAV